MRVDFSVDHQGLAVGAVVNVITGRLRLEVKKAKVTGFELKYEADEDSPIPTATMLVSTDLRKRAFPVEQVFVSEDEAWRHVVGMQRYDGYRLPGLSPAGTNDETIPSPDPGQMSLDLRDAVNEEE